MDHFFVGIFWAPRGRHREDPKPTTLSARRCPFRSILLRRSTHTTGIAITWFSSSQKEKRKSPILQNPPIRPPPPLRLTVQEVKTLLSRMPSTCIGTCIGTCIPVAPQATTGAILGHSPVQNTTCSAIQFTNHPTLDLRQGRFYVLNRSCIFPLLKARGKTRFGASKRSGSVY